VERKFEIIGEALAQLVKLLLRGEAAALLKDARRKWQKLPSCTPPSPPT